MGTVCDNSSDSLMCLRILKSFDIKQSHPDKTPVYIDTSKNAGGDIQIENRTMIIPQSARLSSVIEKLRKGMDAHEANANAGYLFFVKDGGRKVLPSPSDIISTLYKKYVDIDGFLHIIIDREDIFG